MNGGRGFLLTLANKRFVRARVARLIIDIPIWKIWETSTETFNSQKQTSNIPQVFPLYWDDPCSKKSKQFKQQKFKGTKDYKLWISSPNKKKMLFLARGIVVFHGPPTLAWRRRPWDFGTHRDNRSLFFCVCVWLKVSSFFYLRFFYGAFPPPRCRQRWEI